VERAGKSLEKSELEMMNELPRENSDRMIKLVSMLYDSAVSFMKSHSLKLSMPEGSVSRALVEGKSFSCFLQLDKKLKWSNYAIVLLFSILCRRLTATDSE
jgi:hypothetical protein